VSQSDIESIYIYRERALSYLRWILRFILDSRERERERERFVENFDIYISYIFQSVSQTDIGEYIYIYKTDRERAFTYCDILCLRFILD
jgi:hypothetical protein